MSTPDPAEAETEARKNAGFATTFDHLITSNLNLTMAVGRLVRLSWAIILLNLALIATVGALVGWVMLMRAYS